MASIFVVSGSSPHQATGSFRQGQGRAPAGRRAGIHESTGIARPGEGHRLAVLRVIPHGAMASFRRESRIRVPKALYCQNQHSHNTLYIKHLQKHRDNRQHAARHEHGLMPPFFHSRNGIARPFPSHPADRACCTASALRIFMRIFRIPPSGSCQRPSGRERMPNEAQNHGPAICLPEANGGCHPQPMRTRSKDGVTWHAPLSTKYQKHSLLCNKTLRSAQKVTFLCTTTHLLHIYLYFCRA